ncbi:uncharacterized protein LOC123522856 [Mercenaria mercenaria]|uniref:uncharacterized protein LOC123522856 n=1 Tax=Mercenaria mercenaria TaxID=6596 RepID=UPI00234F5EB7|nr:uncharacterized protein LOC123522856 [Mercenaria mercenaria]XP_045156269.2 uncharacterized protein LOC123522856 [Mercenaria mercenaria]
MAHQRHLEKTKYRQWVKAGLGLTYLREGISPFCDDIAKQQHKHILDNIKQTKTLSAVACGQCNLATLRPDHSKGGNRSCMLGQRNCNCCNPGGKIACPNKVCGAIYDTIVREHGFTPPAPYWKNTESRHWCTDPWSIAKCFINAPGYDMKASATDIDCIGLLHLIRNNQYFHNHIRCTISQHDIFSKVIADRNEIFHSSTMELEETEANNYIDDMIAVLHDSKELNNRQNAKDAVLKLEKLKNKDFIITTENEAKLIRDVAEEIRDMLVRFENKTEDMAPKEECDRLKKQLSELELVISELKEEMNSLKVDVSSQQEPLDYEQSKLDLQRSLIQHYREDVLRMSALPQQQEGNLCDFKDVYVRPRMAMESKDDLNDKPNVSVVVSLSDIFKKDGKPVKSIYILGEAGSGKSSFCKSLINYWCLAHSEEGQRIEDEFRGIKEMKKFKFLFFLPLHHYTDKMKIKEMLEEKYEHPALKKILEYESRTCLVVLDGLDEWASPASKYPPERSSLKGYTVLTTSRPWKIAALGISDNEIRQKIVLKGFDDNNGETSVKKLIEKTVPILNKMFKKDKDPVDCEKALAKKSLASLKHTAITLQQLICLWFDDKLCGETSRCALYTEILDLLFVWHKKKYPDDPLFTEMMTKSKDLNNIELPCYLINTEVCKSYSYIIQDVSRLSYETLFNNTKETSLSFDSSTFERLKISNEVKTCCLKIGILSEDKCQSLSASSSRTSAIAFVHKSFQEYLAAVYIAIRSKNYIASSTDSGNPDFPDHCEQLIIDFFSKCASLDLILEQANVFSMLCGLQPRIATSISKYIYDIVSGDMRVHRYRRTINYGHINLISNVQKCILNCIEEMQVYGTRMHSNFYLGDVYVNTTSNCDRFCTSFEKRFILPDRVMSFAIDTMLMENYPKKVSKYLPKCQRLEGIEISNINEIDDEDIKSICDAIEGNISTLKALYLYGLKLICRTTARRLPDMGNLVALLIQDLTMPHEVFTSLCSFLSVSSHLKQVSISNTRCKPITHSVFTTDSECSTVNVFHECINQHEVDLSKHQHLQYLEYDDSVTVTRINSSNLEIFHCRSSKSTDYAKVFDNLSTANKLTELFLVYDIRKSHSDFLNPSHHTVTDKLITLLPLLHQLHELTLSKLTFTDNIMKFPAQMKSMKSIELHYVTMSLTTWRQFADSLHLIPFPVQVKAVLMCITRDGEKCNRLMRRTTRRGGEEAAAWQYVREQEFFIYAEDDDTDSIEFSTKK